MIPTIGDTAAVPERRSVYLRGGELPHSLDEIDAGLVEQHAAVFRRNGRLVRPVENVIAVRDGEQVTDLILVEARPAMIEVITRHVLLGKYDARKKAPVTVNCPRDLADAYLARGSWSLRTLTGVINAPTLRPDGSVIDQPGYDASTGVLYEPQPGVTFPTIPTNPSRKDALGALAVIDDLIGEFPFVPPDMSRAVAVAAFLTGVIRRSLPTAPAFGFTAPVAGTGKGLLCNTIAMVSSGRKPSPITQASEEETEKRLSGLLMRGDQVIAIDNCTEPLGGSKLMSVLTEQLAALRPLGGSQIVDHLTNVLFLVNGNNLSMVGDMCRRVLVCELDPRMEHPEQREFDFSPLDLVSHDRGRYLVACLTILLAYRAAGMPKQQGVAIGSYGEWACSVRDALLWLGLPDIGTLIAVNKSNDPIAEKVMAVFYHWAEVIGTETRITAKAVVQAAEKAASDGKPGLIDALHAVAAPMVRGSGFDRVDTTRLGKWFGRHKGRNFGGKRLMLLPEKHDGNGQWCLEEEY